MKQKFLEILAYELGCDENEVQEYLIDGIGLNEVLTSMLRASLVDPESMFNVTTEDGVEINAATDSVYSYRKSSRDGYPTAGTMDYDFYEEKWIACTSKNDPVFYSRKAVDRYINSLKTEKA